MVPGHHACIALYKLLHFNTRSEINNMRHSERPLLSSHTAFSKIKALEVGFYLGGGSAFVLLLSVEKQCNSHI